MEKVKKGISSRNETVDSVEFGGKKFATLS
jgi:hypothetical protein